MNAQDVRELRKAEHSDLDAGKAASVFVVDRMRFSDLGDWLRTAASRICRPRRAGCKEGGRA